MSKNIEQLDARLPWWRGMDAQRQAVFVELVEQMGADRFLSLDKMLSAASVGAYDIAGAYLRDSGWYFDRDGSTRDLSRMFADGAKNCRKKSNAA
jgi:hypothetical protein